MCKTDHPHLRSLSILFTCIVFFLSANPFQGIGQAPESEYGLLWEVTHPNQEEPSYLFGTMHVMDENIFNLPDSVFIGIKACDGFATEVAFDEAMNEVVSWYIERADEIEGKRRSESLERQLENLLGEPKAGADPLALFQNMGENYQAGEDQATFLDAWLYRIARDDGKVVGGVEDLESQMVLLLDEGNLFGGGAGRVSIDFLKAAYIKGDLKAIEAYLESDEVSDGFREQVLVKRNFGMADQADSLMGIRPTFVAVGAAHLPGKEGVIQLLRDKGYQLRRVEATYSGMAEEYKDLPFKPLWQTFEDPEMGLRVEVPAQPFPVNVMDMATMQFGMDLPGGFFYAFYRLQLPVYLGEDERRSTITEVVSAMGEEIKERKDVTIGDFEGEEIFAAAQDFDFRVRVLFDGRSMLFMLVGISETIVRSEAADRFMESVETYIPPSIFSREWKQQEFEAGRFSVKFPGPPDYAYDPGLKEDAENEVEFRSYLYDLEDTYHSQYIMVRITDLAPLSNELPDSSWTYEIAMEYADIDQEDLEVKSVERNGIQGWESQGKADGYTMHFRQINRGFRSYLLLMSALEEDSLSDRVGQFFDSFSYQPLPAPELKTQFEAENFKVRLPDLPSVEEGGWAYVFLNGAEGMNTWAVRDSVSATGFVIESYPLSPYFRTDHPDSLVMEYQGDFGNDISEVMNTLREENGMLVADRELEHKNGDLYIYQRHFLDGDHIREFSLRVPGDIEDRGFVKEFFQTLTVDPNGAYQGLKEGKAREILELLSRDDVEASEEAASSLWQYDPLPEEEAIFMDWVTDNPKADPGILGRVMVLIAEFDNSDADSFILKHIDLLEQNPDAQSEILIYLFNSKREGAAQTASKLFSNVQPVALERSYIDELVLAIVNSDPGTFWNKENLRLLIDKGEYFNSLTYEVFYRIASEEWSGTQSRKALDIQLDLAYEVIKRGFVMRDDSKLFSLAFENLTNCFEYVEWGNREIDFCRDMFDLAEVSFQVRCAIRLLKHGESVSSGRLVEFADNLDDGFPLIEYLVGEGRRNMLPGKYFKQKFAAESSLRFHIAHSTRFGAGEVVEMKLLETEKVYWKGISSNLFVYKVLMNREEDYMVGFAGPFLADKKLAWPEQKLTGLSYRRYDPDLLDKLISDWYISEGNL